MIFGLEPGFFALVMVVGVIGFVLSSVFGVGGAVLLIPLLAQRMPAVQAVAIAAPVMLSNNVFKAIVFKRHIHKRAFFLVSGLALPAAFVGAVFSTAFDDRVILLGVAALILLSVVVERGFGQRVKMSERALFLWGGVTGAVSGLVGAAGPPTAIGLKGYGLDREQFVGTVALFAVLLQAVKIPAYVSSGALPAERWPLAAALAAAGAGSVLVAPKLLHKVPKHAFGWALDGLLLVSAVWIVIDVARR